MKKLLICCLLLCLSIAAAAVFPVPRDWQDDSIGDSKNEIKVSVFLNNQLVHKAYPPGYTGVREPRVEVFYNRNEFSYMKSKAVSQGINPANFKNMRSGFYQVKCTLNGVSEHQQFTLDGGKWEGQLKELTFLYYKTSAPVSDRTVIVQCKNGSENVSQAFVELVTSRGNFSGVYENGRYVVRMKDIPSSEKITGYAEAKWYQRGPGNTVVAVPKIARSVNYSDFNHNTGAITLDFARSKN